MKKIIEKYLLSIIICFLFIAAVPVAVSAQENTNTSPKNVMNLGTTNSNIPAAVITNNMLVVENPFIKNASTTKI